MSVSRHPVALRLEQLVGGPTKLLATVMALPLIDGIFPALVVAGVLASTTGVIETGVLIFGGSATVAVILAEMDGSRKETVASVLLIGAVIIPVAAVQAALAPTVEGFLNLDIFERFAGLVILAVAAKTASAEFGEYLPSPGVIIGLGLIASLTPGGFAIDTSTEYVVNGTAAAAIGVAFALSVALLSPHLRGRVNIDRFRFGSAVALGVLALPILLRPFGVMQTEVPVALAVLCVTALFAYDPDAEGISSDDTATDDGSDDDPESGHPTHEDRREADVDADDDTRFPLSDSDDPPLGSPEPGNGIADEDVSVTATTDGEGSSAAAASDEDPDPDDEPTDPFAEDDSRAPWL